MDTRARRLEGKRVAVLAADGFEYIELMLPRHALRLAGARVDVISLQGGRILGMALTEPIGTVRVDRTVKEADANDYSALFVPGGFIAPDLLRQSRLAREFVRAFDVAQKPIAALCHGPWLLASAELVSGRHLTSWPGIRDDIVHAGGTWHDEALVLDRNWLSSRGPQDLPEFIRATIQLFAAHALGAESLNEALAPAGESSPKAERPYDFVVTAGRLIPGPLWRSLFAACVGAALGLLIARSVPVLAARG